MTQQSEFTPRPGVKKAQSLKIGVLGFNHAGKTLSSLKMARGIAGPNGKIIVIDTHNGQSEEYVGHEDVGQFEVIDLRPPFRPLRCLEAVEAAVQHEADVIIFDSASHEWDGDGGVLEFKEEIEADLIKREKGVSVNVWTKPKMQHKRFINHLLGISQHVILCIRLKQTIDPGSKKDVIGECCDNQILYDLTINVTIDRETHAVTNARVGERYKECIKDGQLIGNVHGEMLIEEANRGIVDKFGNQLAELESAAERGGSVLKTTMERMKNNDVEAYRDLFLRPGLKDRLVQIAKSADTKTLEDEDMFPGDKPFESQS